ncbi:GNAT family N-acetyltransferase [Bacillus sp. 1P06AnD]|uniref:GNAT family N-acetyltransferase n=1 Tax=Bacillus sp. 1P06AnD TaxID=3132208 RepID=UPI0039A0B1D5
MNIEDIYGDLPEIETERLSLRKLTLDDLTDMHEYTSNNKVSTYVTWDRHQSLADTKGFIHFVLKQYTEKRIAPWGIVHKQDRKLIGTIDFVKWETKHRSAELGYAISENYWGRGLTTEAAKALLIFGFEQMDLLRIQARCLAENIASESVMKKIGMQYEGTLRQAMLLKGKHRDIKMYSILLNEYQERNKKETLAQTER